MDILGMLQNDVDDLCKEDMDMIEEELLIGDYSEEYIDQCRIHINRITHYFEEKKRVKAYKGPEELTSRLFVYERDLVADKQQQSEGVVTSHKKTPVEILREKLVDIRSKADPEKRFVEYIGSEELITNEFIDNNLGEFTESERSLLLRERSFDEAFLDKYFDVLDHGTIIINQKFSEEFFMKHFDDMNTKLVLTRSKNEWRTKGKRSKKLDTFLRLKGVKI